MTSTMLDQLVDATVSARTELLVFFFAITLHYFMFGSALSRRGTKRRGEAASKGAIGPKVEAGDGSDGEEASPSGAQLLRASQAAYDRGDHRGVLRGWKGLKKLEHVPAAHLAQVVESMQRLKRDGAAVLGEVCGFLRRLDACNAAYISDFLEPLARSLDVELVRGIQRLLPSLGVTLDARGYQVLVQMHFSTRSFDAVVELSEEMRCEGVQPTARTTLAFLKTSLHLGRFELALQYYRDMVSLQAGRPSASAAPGHIATQLVELACREHRAADALLELEQGKMKLTTDMLNVMLGESARLGDENMVVRLGALASRDGVTKNAKTCQMMVRCAGDDAEKVSCVVEQMVADGNECHPEVIQAVLSVCAQTNNDSLADVLRRRVESSASNYRTTALLALIRYYSESNAPAKACDLYDVHFRRGASASPPAALDPQRRPVDSRTQRLVVSCALRCGREDLASELLEQSPGDTARHISVIRSLAARNRLPEALQVFEGVRGAGADVPPSLWNTALDACVECHDLKRAEALFAELRSEGLADAVSFNTLIKAFLRKGAFARAESLMADMESAGCQPNDVTYNELINAYVRSDHDGQLQQAWEAVDRMERAGIQPNRVTCSILLKSLKATSPQHVVSRAMDIASSTSEPVDEVLLSSIVEACMRVGCAARLSRKLRDFREQRKVVVTGAHTFGSLIKAYGFVKDMEGVWHCWKEMRSQHIKPTSITIGCMVEAVVSNGDVEGGYELVLSLLDDAACKDQVNAVVFGSVLKGFGRKGSMDRMWSVLQDMIDRGIAPSVINFNAVIDACTRRGQMDRLPGLMDMMRSRGLQPNLITFSTLIKGYCNAGDMQAALATLEDLRQAPGLKPDEIVYNTLLDGCGQSGLVAEGEALFDDMQETGVSPTSYTLSAMVRLLGNGRQLDRAFEVVNATAKKYRFRPNSYVYVALVNASLLVRDTSRALSAFDQATISRMPVDGKASYALIRALASEKRHVQAANVLRISLGTGKQQSHQQSSTNRGNQSIDDRSACDAILRIAEAGGSRLGASLLDDFRALRPRARIDPALLSRLTSA